MSASELFETVTAKVNSTPALPLSEDVKLKLYGHFKRATVGTTQESNSSAPSIFNIVAKKKWNAWVACDGMTKEESMIGYVKLVAGIDCDLGKESQALLDEYEQKQN